MEFLKITVEERIANIFLNHGRSNAMHLEMVDELIVAIQQASEDEAVEGLILHGKEGFFSSGLDLISLYNYDREEMATFWDRFMVLIQTLAAFPKPSVAAISGHSPAGGCVLALTCDNRVMVEGDFVIGLNEIPVGIVVPQSIFELYSFWIGPANAYRNLLEGKLMKPEEALAIQLIDELVPANRIQTAASRRVKTLMQFEKNAWRKSKMNLRAKLLETMSYQRQESIDEILEQWWSPATRSVLKTVIDSLTTKKQQR